ncbi:LysR family transcriptional regulator [Pacificibacter marinus]|uniref:LysR family transcriptional regulator n=1 Tax=Pacificibacter marinus TaxID=658057 RepID=UPI001C07636D|nr:LysR family transcriptional regulator [Pacificibacter marinus]MBU2866424.1 LysR family transcriptional regulator [Pacificibacter marinus]
MNTLDPRQTECFLAAVQTGTIRSAAEQLGLEPSTVSRNISALETATATTLIERGRNGVRLTEAGTLLLGYIHKQAAALEVLQSEFDALAHMKRGNILIAVGEGFVSDLIDHAMSAFNKRYSDITFSLSVGSTEYVSHLVATEEAHLGLAYNVPSDPRLRVEMSARQPLVALVRKEGAFDTGAAFDLKRLASLPCAVPPKSFGVGTMIAASEARHGVRMQALVETGSIAALTTFVRNDMGYTILPRFVVEAELASGLFSAYPIIADTFQGGVAALVRKEGRRLPQAAQLFIKQLAGMAAFR